MCSLIQIKAETKNTYCNLISNNNKVGKFQIFFSTLPSVLNAVFVAALAKIEYLLIGSPCSCAMARIVFKFLQQNSSIRIFRPLLSNYLITSIRLLGIIRSTLMIVSNLLFANSVMYCKSCSDNFIFSWNLCVLKGACVKISANCS